MTNKNGSAEEFSIPQDV
jgi:hypothetical protein